MKMTFPTGRISRPLNLFFEHLFEVSLTKEATNAVDDLDLVVKKTGAEEMTIAFRSKSLRLQRYVLLEVGATLKMKL